MRKLSHRMFGRELHIAFGREKKRSVATIACVLQLHQSSNSKCPTNVDDDNGDADGGNEDCDDDGDDDH